MNKSNLPRKTPIQLIVLNILALGGVGVSVALTQHFYDVRNGISGFKSFCNIAQTMNCDIVASSSYAELFWGLPLSSFAAGWFLALFIVALFAYNPYWRRDSLRAAFGITGLGSLLSIPYIFIMASQLKTFCLLCLILDVFSLSSFALVLSFNSQLFSAPKPDWSKWKVLGSVIGSSIFFTVLLLRTLESASMPNSDSTDLSRSILNSPPLAMNEGRDLPSIGSSTAPITIVEFSDFQCPFCRIGAFALHSVMNRYPGQIRVIFRNFPLDQSCNSAFTQTAHPYACEAARVALCGHRQGKFESTYQDLFEHQDRLANGKLPELTKKMELDLSQLQNCTSSSEIAIAIARDVNEATALGVKSTPTFFINGHKMEGAYPVEVWNTIIDHLLLNKK